VTDPLTKMDSECFTCGYPALRQDAHAEWCAAISLLNTQEPVVTKETISAYLPPVEVRRV